MTSYRYRYRLTHAVTTDYGDGPAAGIVTIGHYAVIPDGSNWMDRPATFTRRLPEGTRLGEILAMNLEVDKPAVEA